MANETCTICGKPIGPSLSFSVMSDGRKVCGECLGQHNQPALAFWSGRGWLKDRVERRGTRPSASGPLPA